ncbi:MAG: extracellular solute-binding protein [Proteobacteria bacterium]|nr:extracellular solute-binding protein [Pseudomonadota bacterium]
MAPCLNPRSCLGMLLLCWVSLVLAVDEQEEVPDWQHGLSFFGEFKYPQGFEHFDYVNPDAPPGGRLVRAINGAFNSFTPFIAKGIGAPGVSVIGEMTVYDSLLWPSGDEVGVFYGNLAERVAVSDDQTRIRMRLRPEARWHDGVPVTARDIKFTFEHIRDNAFPGVKAAYLSIKQVDVVSEREVLFTYHYPVNLNAMMALGKVAMMPEHYWRSRDSSKTTIEPPLSSGPYRIGKFKLGKFIEFERVDDYWGRNLGVHRGRHNIGVLRYDVYRDATVQREALRKGLIDYFAEPSAAQWVTGYDLQGERAELLLQEKHHFKQYVGVVSALAFNLSKARFQDVRVREALSLAFDFDWMNEVLDYGAYEKAESFYHGTFLGATGLPSEDELALLEPFRNQLPTRVFIEPPFGQSSIAALRGRDAIVRAQHLLREAGWRFTDGRLLDQDGNPFEIEFLINSADGKRTLLPYVDNLRRLGIEASIRLVETAQFLNLRRQNINDAVFGSLAISMPPNLEMPAYFGSTSRGVANFSRLSSSVVDRIIERILNAGTRAELVAASRALDRVLYWQFYYIPIRVLEPQRVLVWNRYRKPDQMPLYYSGFPDTWWWDESRSERVTRMHSRE